MNNIASAYHALIFAATSFSAAKYPFGIINFIIIGIMEKN